MRIAYRAASFSNTAASSISREQTRDRVNERAESSHVVHREILRAA